jgi:replicative DNA helicase
LSEEADILLRTPPQNLEAEQSVLGAILLDNDAIDRASEIIGVEDFYRERHRQIFQAMLDLASARKPIDPVTLSSQLGSKAVAEIGGTAYLGELASIVPTARNIAHYARTIHDAAILRDAASALTGLASAAYEVRDVPEFLANLEYETARVLSKQLRQPEPGKVSVLATALWKIEHGREDSVRSGFDTLDQCFGGFNVGHLTMLAARTSRGKTALATNIAINAACAGNQVAFFSLEQPADEMWLRAVGRVALVDFFAVRHRGYRDGEKERIAKAREQLESVPLEILYRPGLRPRDLRIQCRRLAREMGGLKLVIVDYFNLMRGDRREKERWREMMEAILALKQIAGELAVPILLLSQLNRENDERQPPSLSTLRDTGATEEHASNVLMLWQSPRSAGDSAILGEEEEIQVILAKQRNGPAGMKVPMRFAKKYGAFFAA